MKLLTYLNTRIKLLKYLSRNYSNLTFSNGSISQVLNLARIGPVYKVGVR